MPYPPPPPSGPICPVGTEIVYYGEKFIGCIDKGDLSFLFALAGLLVGVLLAKLIIDAFM